MRLLSIVFRSAIVLPLLVTQCGLDPLGLGNLGLNDVSSTIQNAIDRASVQSDAWREVLPQLVTDLNGMETKVSNDAKETLNDTINQASAFRDQTFSQADYLAKDTVAFTAIEAQCTASYFQSSVVSFLQYLKARVANKNAPRPASRVCAFNPDHFDVDPNNLSGPNANWFANVYGYNLFSDALPNVQVLDGSNQTVRSASNKPVSTSLYQMQLQLVGSDLAGLKTGYRVGLVWPDGTQNQISINVSAPAQLEVVGFQFPSDVTVGDAVIGRVTVRNSGTASSGAFAIKLTVDTARGHVIDDQAETSLPGGSQQTYDLLSFSYSQRDYFNVPVSDPVSGVQAVVQLVGNAGVGQNSSRSASTTIHNRPFRTLPPIKINNPDVHQPWTLYEPTVPVQPGDVVTVTDAGGCVQTGGSGATWKRYVDPRGSNADRLYHGLVAIVPLTDASLDTHKPPSGTRVQGNVGRAFRIPLDVSPSPQFYLGYEDDDYSGNGYSDHDDGTDNQCQHDFGAWVTIQIQRN